MSEKIELRKEVQWFAEQMELVLRQHDHKGGWQAMTARDLFLHVEHEKMELVEAITVAGDVTREAVDLANFCMMIADNWERLKA